MRVCDVLDAATPYVPPTAAAEWLLAAHPCVELDALGANESERYVVAMQLAAEAAELGERITAADLRDTIRAAQAAQDRVWHTLTPQDLAGSVDDWPTEIPTHGPRVAL